MVRRKNAERFRLSVEHLECSDLLASRNREIHREGLTNDSSTIASVSSAILRQNEQTAPRSSSFTTSSSSNASSESTEEESYDPLQSKLSPPCGKDVERVQTRATRKASSAAAKRLSPSKRPHDFSVSDADSEEDAHEVRVMRNRKRLKEPAGVVKQDNSSSNQSREKQRERMTVETFLHALRRT